MLDIPANARRCVKESVVRFVKAFDALVAVGRVRRVGRVRELRVYDRPVSKPSETVPTNFKVGTALVGQNPVRAILKGRLPTMQW